MFRASPLFFAPLFFDAPCRRDLERFRLPYFLFCMEKTSTMVIRRSTPVRISVAMKNRELLMMRLSSSLFFL